MPKFRYIAYNSLGKRQSGYVEADSKAAAIAHVKSQGLQPTAMYGPYGRQPGAGGLNLSRVRIKHLAAYTRKFSQLYNAGIPLNEIFGLLSEEEDVRILRNVSKDLADDVGRGMQIEEALRKYPAIFPPLFVTLFKTGLDSGTLDRIADRLATLYEKESELRTQVWSKLAYPIAMLGLVFLFALLLAHFRAVPLPLVYSILTVWAIIIGAIIFFCTPIGYPILRTFLMFTPYIGPLMVKTDMSRFCRMMSILYSSGIPLLESLDLAQSTVQDPRLIASIKRVKENVNQGDDLAVAMKKAGMIPAKVVSMVAVGERGGSVGAVLEKVSAYYDIEIEHQHQVLLVTGYLVSFMLMAITAAILIISFWAGYWGNINSLLE